MTYPHPVVTPAWLAQHLNDPRVVVIDCRFALNDPRQGAQQYAAGHIPGAGYLDLNQDLSSSVQAHGGRHPLPEVMSLSAKLTALGVVSEGLAPTLVVAYDDSRFAFAARLWWLLQYLGHDQVAVLNGGWSAWVAEGHPTSTATPNPRPGQFEPHPRHDQIVDIARVRQSLSTPGLRLIDSRSPERYRGEVEPIDPVAGSIPGAVNYFWQNVSTDQGWLQDPATLATHWADLEGAEEVIVYCGSGVTACVNLLAMAVAGRPLSKLYPGGWSDWCSYSPHDDG
jgi:thiosulfate/3-mercaptopyruvate sulfurtransferase